MSATERYDVIIVGAGPAGLSAAAHAQANDLKHLLLEKGSIANTIGYYYQYGKFVMSLPALIPLRSDLPFEAGSREEILDVWLSYAAQHELQIRTDEAVSEIVKQKDHFTVTTPQSVYEADKLVLAIGRMGNPRKLGVAGEDLEHVANRLIDPRTYVDQDILVVGGGDSAAEVALALCEQNRVAISYRSAEFYRMNDSLRAALADKIEQQTLTPYLSSEVEHIEKGAVTLSLPDRTVRIKADSVLVKIGAEVPRQFLQRCGVTFASDDAFALPIINERYETQVPGLYLIGSTAGQDLIKYGLNQGFDVIEYILGYEVEPVDAPELRRRLHAVPGDSVSDKLAFIAARVPLLEAVPTSQLRELLLVSTLHQVDAGHTIFQQHDYSTTFFSIVDGSVGISLPDQHAAQQIVLRAGEFLGEMGLLADRRRSATATTLQPALLIETPRRTMLKLIAGEPSVKQHIDETYILRALQTYLCPAIDAASFRQVSSKAKLQTFKKDQVIFAEGTPGDTFYVVRSGSVKISKKNNRNKVYVVTYLSAGQYFGEMALLGEVTERDATVTAATRTQVICIAQEDFLAFLQEHPNLQQQIRREIDKRRLETAVILQAPAKSSLLDDFIKLGVVESTDVLLIDETKCIRCDNCVSACRVTHDGQTRLDRKHGPSFAHLHIPVSCRHCEGAPCLQDCPPGDAIMRDPRGVVRIDEQKCIGCGNCAGFCPYGVIFMVEAEQKTTLWERFNILNLLSRKPSQAVTSEGHRAMAVKCDLCEGINGGPACVQHCPTGAAIRVTPEFFRTVDFTR